MADKKQRPTAESRATMSDLTHARHDPGHILAPGLFRSLGAGDRKKLKLDVSYVHGDLQIDFQGFEPLGADDMRVLQGLVAMSGPDGMIMRDHDELKEGPRQLLLSLFKAPKEFQIADNKPDTLVVKDSFRRVAREIGMSEGGKSLTNIRKSIERLYGVTVFVQKGTKRQGTRLLASYSSNEETGELYVALNPRLSAAIVGTKQHARIDLDEVRNLSSDPARLIHQRLCGWIDAGKQGTVKLDTLSEYVWPDTSVLDGTIRRRRGKVRIALDELRSIGWTVTERKDGVCLIARPRMINN